MVMSLSTVAAYINDGWITAYNGAGQVYFDYDVTTPGKTTLWTDIRSRNPLPADNSPDVDYDVNLGLDSGLWSSLA